MTTDDYRYGGLRLIPDSVSVPLPFGKPRVPFANSRLRRLFMKDTRCVPIFTDVSRLLPNEVTTLLP